MEKFQTKRFALTVAASGSGELKSDVDFPARVVEVAVRVYAGNELSLQLVPVLRYRGEATPLVEFAEGGHQYIVGDDDAFVFKTDVDAPRGSTLGVQYTNTDAVNAYDFAVDITLHAQQGSGA